MQDHHKLDVWRRAHEHAVEVRRALRKIADSEHRSLKTQAKRAAESIVFNIIEGCHARTNKEFARFLDISIKSTGELEGQLELARDYESLPRTTCKPLCDETIEIRKMLCGLRRSVLERDAQNGVAEPPPKVEESRDSNLDLKPHNLDPPSPRDDS